MQCPYCKEEIKDGATKCKHCGSAIGGALTDSLVSQSSIGEMFSTALTIWKEHLVSLVVMTLVFFLVVWIPIANIGFIAGYVRSLIKVTRGEGKPSVGDIFTAWDCFGKLLVYVLILFIASAIVSIIPLLGTLLAIALGFIAFPGMYAIIDNNRDIVGAFKWSLASIKANLVNWLLVYIAGYVLAVVGFILLVVGVLFTGPLGALLMIQQSERVKSS